jgi:ribosomal protein S18 acetylase RimI-like enzyme
MTGEPAAGELTFREAVRGDVPAIVALLREDPLGARREGAADEAYLAAFDAMLAEPHNRIIVGEAGGRVVACCQLTLISGLSREGTRRAQVEAVRVSVAMRGAGVGEALMRDAEARARAAGCRLIQLTSDRTRERAHGFYERLGYAASHLGFKRAL